MASAVNVSIGNSHHRIATIRKGNIILINCNLINDNLTLSFVWIKFDKDSQEMNVYLNDVQGHLESLASSSLNLPSWSKSTCEEFTTQFNIFKHNFQVRSSPAQQIERLYELVKKMPSYRMRKMNLRSPYENAQILTDYYLVEVCVVLIIFEIVSHNFIISFVAF